LWKWRSEGVVFLAVFIMLWTINIFLFIFPRPTFDWILQ
jgi:hypothetical protein